jgi:endo-1,4-beta-mannosidase
MRFGVNYTPRQRWFHHWLDFDEGEVARDFDVIRQLEVDHLRVFPLWPVFQPNPTMMNAAALRALERTLELAAERGLDVAVDGLQGHLSSFDFVPSWLRTWHRRNLFADVDAIEAEASYLEAIGRACAGHPNLLALTVGNEVNQFAGVEHPDREPLDAEGAGEWLDAMLTALRRAAPGTPVVHACYDASWYESTQPFTLDHVARAGDMTVVHSWVFNGVAQLYGPDAFETRAHARYLIEVARAFQADAGRPIWLQEVGIPRTVLPAASVPDFVAQTVAHVASAPDLYGITWWCSHDVPRRLADFPDVEYALGLIDEHNRLKPEGVLVREAVVDARSARPPRASGRIIELDAGLPREALAPGGAFFERYMGEARALGHPRVVRAD